jgi:bifunctional non-homologous end joining protein LigD
MGLEGIISKVAASTYRSGRNENWVKSKCVLSQEFAVIGYCSASAPLRQIEGLH